MSLQPSSILPWFIAWMHRSSTFSYPWKSWITVFRWSWTIRHIVIVTLPLLPSTIQHWGQNFFRTSTDYRPTHVNWHANTDVHCDLNVIIPSCGGEKSNSECGFLCAFLAIYISLHLKHKYASLQSFSQYLYAHHECVRDAVLIIK